MLAPLRRVLLPAFAAVLLGTTTPGHGYFVKPCFNVEEDSLLQWFNSKANAATRGGAGAAATQIYMAEPPLHHTAQGDVFGFRVMLQDEEASTQETLDLSFVRYAADGVSPDESPGGVLLSLRVPAFGFGMQGKVAFDFVYTLRSRRSLATPGHLVGLQLPANASWPQDGISVLGQLNLPNDPLRPRISPPHDRQVWAFERPGTQASATPLGGRSLDTLLLTTIWVTAPVLQHFLVSCAYTGPGGPPERLFGPESMHPETARGDLLGFRVQGGDGGGVAVGLLFLAPALAATPFQIPGTLGSGWVYLDFTAPFPVLLAQGTFDPALGRMETTPIAFQDFPPGLRDFWVQGLIVDPMTWVLSLTDCVGVKGW